MKKFLFILNIRIGGDINCGKTTICLIINNTLKIQQESNKLTIQIQQYYEEINEKMGRDSKYELFGDHEQFE